MLDQTVACFMGIREGNDQFVLILKLKVNEGQSYFFE